MFTKMNTFVVCVTCLFSFFLSNAIEVHRTSHVVSSNLESSNLQRSNDQGRPSYHFRPPNNWLNGPMYYKGVYHLFYQYNPYGAVFNQTIVWGHGVSRDLINWVHLKTALFPTNAFDIKSCWSGSTTFVKNKPFVLYTGLDAKNQQVQNLAIPKNLSDPFLETWVKYSGNPIMTRPGGVKPDDFRDPTTAWKGRDGVWRVLVGGQKNDQGVAILYRSRDFLHWTLYNEPFYSVKNTGVWECPDFYPVLVNGKNGADNSIFGSNLDVKYVLKVSFNAHDYYAIGRYDGGEEKFVPESREGFKLRYDYGKFYASKTFFDFATNRRILWGWINESDSSSDDIKKGWAGIQSIPRQLFLNSKATQLVQWPTDETKTLRDKHVAYRAKRLKRHSLFEVSGITTSQADIEVLFKLPKLEEVEPMKSNDAQLVCSTKTAQINGVAGPFGLLIMASQDLKEQTAVFFRIFKQNHKYVVLMCSDQSRSSLRQGVDKTTYGAFMDIDPSREKISLRSLVDRSVIESFGGEGRACITARVYPKFLEYQEAHIYAFNNGSLDVVMEKFDAWSMKKANMNSIIRK